ncbi:MAG: prepilin-type N-terminal cleavage/methylation domain-containing protein [Nitrospirae bacterium]|nr:prepilin-type N-terminal cleavage/methylation domain-containing protein [Nitrospirota bacterium]
MKSPRIIHNAPGFTLLEVMVALLIIATSFIVLLHSRNQSVIAADYARHMTIATLLATEKMGEMEQGGIDTTGEDSGNFGEAYPEFLWRTIISDTPYEQVREVRVEISWGEGKGHRSVELVNYIKAVTNE